MEFGKQKGASELELMASLWSEGSQPERLPFPPTVTESRPGALVACLINSLARESCAHSCCLLLSAALLLELGNLQG